MEISSGNFNYCVFSVILTYAKLDLSNKCILVANNDFAQVSVLIGDPIELDDLVKGNTVEFASKGELYDAIAVRVGQRMQLMKEELDQLVAARELQLAAEEAQRLHSVEKAQNLLQYIDWEAQGHLPESDSIAKEHYLELSLMRNSDAYAQISLAQEELSRGKPLSWSYLITQNFGPCYNL